MVISLPAVTLPWNTAPHPLSTTLSGEFIRAESLWPGQFDHAKSCEVLGYIIYELISGMVMVVVSFEVCRTWAQWGKLRGDCVHACLLLSLLGQPSCGKRQPADCVIIQSPSRISIRCSNLGYNSQTRLDTAAFELLIRTGYFPPSENKKEGKERE
jgi:hypothetical protein